MTLPTYSAVWRLALLIVGLSACGTPAPEPDAIGAFPSQALESAFPVRVMDGHTVYVPIYSHIYVENQDSRYAIATTLVVRNTDPDTVIQLTDVSYFDSAGVPRKQFISRVMAVGPMATAEFFVAADELQGGAGASVRVTWESDDQVYEPIVEAIMVGLSGTRAVSFSARGRMYRR